MVKGDLGFHWVNCRFWVLCLNLMGFQVLRCVMGGGFGKFLCLGFKYLIQKFPFLDF